MRRGLTGRMVVASGLLALIVGGAFAAVLLTITDLRGTTDLRRETRESLVAADTLEKHVIDLETGLRGFVITRDESFLQPANDARAALPNSARALERLAADEPVQLARVRRIDRAMNAYLQRYARPLVQAVRRNDPSARSLDRTLAAKHRVDALREGLQSFRAAERARLSVRDADVDHAARRATAAAAVGVAGSIVLIIVFSGYLTRVIVRPLRRAALMANRLAGGDLGARMRETDVAEIGALQRSFNVMAGSLETSRDELASLLAEQAALRRVATLVARGAAPADVFAVTATEVCRLLGTNATALCRYEPDATVTVLALETDVHLGISVGARITLDGESAMGAVFRTGGAARQESFERTTGTLAGIARTGGMRSSVGAPIVVEGRLWGVVVVSSRSGPLPADIERRLVDFTELVATTISNTDARALVDRLAEEQAALRRVATLVAEGASPTTVFDGVAAEMEGLLDADQIAVSRYEPRDQVTVVAFRGVGAERGMRPGTRISHEGDSVTATVRRTESPARMEYAEGATGAIAEIVRALGVRVSVGAPIIVDGRLWGVIQASWNREEPPPAGTEERMAQFGKLLDTANATPHSRHQHKPTRARLVAAGDEARRRLVRDLHDGAQQRLVHTIIVLKQAARALTKNHDGVESLVAEALAQGTEANAELRELAHGIMPAVLTRGGLAAAVDALVSRSPVPVEVGVPEERFSAEVEATAYFVVAEALTNVAKHARAQSAEVRARVDDGALRIDVRDDGAGGADPEGGGLLGLADRIAVLDGELKLESPPGGGTRVMATIPLPDY
jgi:signal transduction histidine kinase/CHASE3 domain sensor protein